MTNTTNTELERHHRNVAHRATLINGRRVTWTQRGEKVTAVIDHVGDSDSLVVSVRDEDGLRWSVEAHRLTVEDE
jgi:DNA polymerase IIIc chi subunit